LQVGEDDDVAENEDVDIEDQEGGALMAIGTG